MKADRAPAFLDIEQAACSLDIVLPSTPLLESDRLNRAVGGRILVKAETLQPTGSFKIRGVWNCVERSSPAARGCGLLALSSGNHGLAVAWASRATGVSRTVILMPFDTPLNKVDKAKDLGTEVVFFDRQTADRNALVTEWCEREGLLYLPAFDHPDVIAGAGTVALEAAKQARAGNAEIDDFFASCSGGGLIAGCALALEHLSPQTRVWGVEPEDYDDTARSLSAGVRVSVSSTRSTICDALTSQSPAELTFKINKRLLAGVVRGGDDPAKLGVKVAFEEFGLVAEPSGALALGAVVADRARTEGRAIVVVLSGRNVNSDIYPSYLDSFGNDGKVRL